jgi:rare lipoprotein A
VRGIVTHTAVALLLAISSISWNSYKATFYTVAENGTRTASGVPYNNYKMTAASNQYPLGTVVVVKNIKTKDSVIVTITDRINQRYSDTRIDLTPRAFKQLAPLHKGIIKVKTRPLWPWTQQQKN